MKLLVIVDFNHIQGFWLYLKIPFLVNTKVKVGQMNWWTKLSNSIVMDSLYNFQSKQVFPPNKNYLAFFCLVLWEQFPCFSLWISCMPQCNIILSVLIFDLYYFSVLLYKDNNLYTIVIVWYFNVVFCAVCFLKSSMLVCVLSKIIVCVLLNFYISLCAC